MPERTLHQAINSNHPESRYVEAVGRRLVSTLSRDLQSLEWHFTLLDDPTPNAFGSSLVPASLFPLKQRQ